jgi:hypothetical protein
MLLPPFYALLFYGLEAPLYLLAGIGAGRCPVDYYFNGESYD